MLIVGERINSTRKQIVEAIKSFDKKLIEQEAIVQIEAGAHYLDINAGIFIEEEVERLKWVIETVQAVSNIPLCIDSPDPDVIKNVLPLVKTRPMINSITLDPFRLESVLPLVREYKAKVIGLCESKDTLAHTKEAKIEMAGNLVEKVAAEGVTLDDLYIDPLVYPIAVDTKSASASLEAVEAIMKQYPEVHTICGLSNISQGLPNRKVVNRMFLVAAITRGLDSVIMDPTDRQLYGALKTALMIMGRDEFCTQYIKAFREERLA